MANSPCTLQKNIPRIPIAIMKSIPKIRVASAVATSALWLLMQHSGAQTPTIYYNFEGGTLNNTGSLGGVGTPLNFGGDEYVTGAPGSSTPGGGLKLSADGSANDNTGEFFKTGFDAGTVGFHNNAYTASAWVNLDSVTGDNMVFGQMGPNTVLHDGFRGDKIHMGHWGNDTTSALAVSTGTWNHYAWTQLTPATFGAGAPANAQLLYQNGYIVASSGSGLLNNAAGEVVVGSSINGGLLGTVDDVAAYNAPLRPNQVQYLASGGSPLSLPAAQGYLPNNLPGNWGGVGTFSVTEVQTNNGLNMNHIDAAVSALRPGNPSVTTSVTGSVSRINFSDPETSNNSGSFMGDLPFLTNTGAADDRIALVAKGTIQVPAAGNYTFRVRGDDGFALRVLGQNWGSVSGGGGVDPLNPQTMYFAGGTGDSNTSGTLSLSPGNYQLEFVGFEGGGGAWQELAVSKDGGPFSLVGDPSTAAVHRPGITSTGWTVTTSLPGGTAVNNISDARADLLNNPGASANNVASINYNDPGFGGPGSIGGDIAFPNNTAADDNDFGLLATGTLVIPATGTYRFGFQGDDGGYLRIAGVSGWSIVENVTGLAIVSDVNGTANPAGDTLWTDALTGNSRTIGEISLTAGSYPIESLFFEKGGGAYFEIFGAEYVAGTPTDYQLLMADGAATLGSLAGLNLVPEPSSGVLLLLGCGFLLRRRRN